MAEEIIVLMADLDDKSQELLSSCYDVLSQNGFNGKQTKGLPYHISIATFSIDKEKDAIKLMNKICDEISSFSIDISNIKTFESGNVLYASPDLSQELLDLRNKITIETKEDYSWVPHITLLIDDSKTIEKSLTIVQKSFKPFKAKITKLHLCAFWPTREILSTRL